MKENSSVVSELLLIMEAHLQGLESLKPLDGIRIEVHERDALSTWNLLTNFFDVRELKYPHKVDENGKPCAVPTTILRYANIEWL